MRVLVTDATRNVGISVIQALAKEGHEVIAVDNRKLPLRSKSFYAAKFFKTPDFDHSGYGQSVLEIIKKTKPDVIIPVLNILWYVKNLQTIERYAKILYPDFEKFIMAFNNQLTIKQCGTLNIPAPGLFNLDQAKSYLRSNRGSGQVVIKPQLDFGGGRGVSYIKDAQEIEKRLQQVEKDYGKAFIQEYIPGGEQNMIALNLLFGEHSNLIAGFAFRKLRQWPTSGGTTAIGESIDANPYIEMTKPFFEKFKWRGPVDIEIKWDTRDDIPKLIEINPRFTGALAFSFHCGINMPHLYCLSAYDSKNQLQKTISYSQGKKFVNVFHLIKSSLKTFFLSANKIRTIKELFSDLKGEKCSYKIYKGDYLIRFSKLLFELKRLIGIYK